MSQHREPPATTLDGTTDTAETVFAMALLWVIPVVALLLTLVRL